MEKLHVENVDSSIFENFELQPFIYTKGTSGNIFLVAGKAAFEKESSGFKTLSILKLQDVDNRKGSWKELKRLKQEVLYLKHPNIVGTLADWFMPNEVSPYLGQLVIQLEYCDLGTLEDFPWKNFPSREEKLKVFWKLVDQIAQGLDFLHRNLIVHRDLKPSNVFLKTATAPSLSISVNPSLHFCVKIGDFGLSKSFDTKKAETCLTFERLKSTDIYLCGITLYETFAKMIDDFYMLFPSTCNFEFNPFHELESLNKKYDGWLTQRELKLLERMTLQDRSKRISVSELLRERASS